MRRTTAGGNAGTEGAGRATAAGGREPIQVGQDCRLKLRLARLRMGQAAEPIYDEKDDLRVAIPGEELTGVLRADQRSLRR